MSFTSDSYAHIPTNFSSPTSPRDTNPGNEEDAFVFGGFSDIEVDGSDNDGDDAEGVEGFEGWEVVGTEDGLSFDRNGETNDYDVFNNTTDFSNSSLHQQYQQSNSILQQGQYYTQSESQQQHQLTVPYTPSDPDEQVTQLQLSGLTVMMVRTRDKVTYKLPDNMSVNSLTPEQRSRLLEQIQVLHSQSLTQQSQQRPVLGQTSMNGDQLQRSIEMQRLRVQQVEDDARRRQEALAGLQGLQGSASTKMQQQRHHQQQQASGDNMPSPSGYGTPDPLTPGGSDQSRLTRKYNKTGKYSKKRVYHQQGVLPARPMSSAPTPMQTVPTSMTTNTLSQLFQANTTMVTTMASTPGSLALSTSNSVTQPIPTNTLQISQPPPQPTLSQYIIPTHQQTLLSLPSVSPVQLHTEQVKRRFSELLAADQRAVYQPNHSAPFTSVEDAVDRLMPYHIYRYPDEDLKSNDRGLIDEVEQTSSALGFFKRFAACRKHYETAQRREAQRSVPHYLEVLAERILVDDERALAGELQIEYQRLAGIKTDVMRRQKDARDQAIFVQRAQELAQLALMQQAQLSGTASPAVPEVAPQDMTAAQAQVQMQLLQQRQQLLALLASQQHQQQQQPQPQSHQQQQQQ